MGGFNGPPAGYATLNCPTSSYRIASFGPTVTPSLFTSVSTTSAVLDRFQQKPFPLPSPKLTGSRAFPSDPTPPCHPTQIRKVRNSPRSPTPVSFSVRLQRSNSMVLASIWKTSFRGSMRPSSGSSSHLSVNLSSMSPDYPSSFPGQST